MNKIMLVVLTLLNIHVHANDKHDTAVVDAQAPGAPAVDIKQSLEESAALLDQDYKKLQQDETSPNFAGAEGDRKYEQFAQAEGRFAARAYEELLRFKAQLQTVGVEQQDEKALDAYVQQLMSWIREHAGRRVDYLLKVDPTREILCTKNQPCPLFGACCSDFGDGTLGSTFKDETYKARYSNGETFHRYFNCVNTNGKGGFPLGRFLTKDRYDDPSNAAQNAHLRNSLAIDSRWGNAANCRVDIHIPSRKVIYVGDTAPTRELPGGGSQISIQESPAIEWCVGPDKICSTLQSIGGRRCGLIEWSKASAQECN